MTSQLALTASQQTTLDWALALSRVGHPRQRYVGGAKVTCTQWDGRGAEIFVISISLHDPGKRESCGFVHGSHTLKLAVEWLDGRFRVVQHFGLARPDEARLRARGRHQWSIADFRAAVEHWLAGG